MVAKPHPSTVDLILHSGLVWTANPAQPRATALAVAGGRVLSVGETDDILRLATPGTRTIDLGGRMVCPGFTDAHTHIENAADWQFQVALTDVNDQTLFNERVAETAARTPPGLWITGGDLGDFSSTLDVPPDLLEPKLSLVDALTPENPLVIRRADHEYFANSRALEIAQITRSTPDMRGGRFGRDDSGELTGMLYGRAGEFVQRLVSPASLEQKLIGTRKVMARLNSLGITAIHDIARWPALTEATISPSFVERSFSNAQIFQTLKDQRELTVRIYAFMPLDNFEGLAEHRIGPGSGDDWLRYGALKIFMDSGVMLPPFDPEEAAGSGLTDGWSYRFVGEERLAERIVAGDAAGFDIGVHVLGDRAVKIALDCFERAAEINGPRDRRHRLIHAWHMAEDDFDRAGKLGVVADVTSDHLLHYSHNLDDSLGHVRAANAFAWRKFIDHGLTVNLVSDLPGAFNKSHVAEVDPLLNMYVAMTRSSANGETRFHPEQAITIEDALRAYTSNPAHSSREEATKGSLAEGKLADLLVLSHNILEGGPESLLDAHVDMTYVGGRLVFERDGESD